MNSHVSLIEFFKKQSKSLFKKFEAGDPAARTRIASIIFNMEDVSLMKAQHVIAVESGFLKWEELVKASESRLRLEIAMHKEKLLSYNGLGSGLWLQPGEDRKVALAKRREELRQHCEQVMEVSRWLQAFVTPIKTLNRNQTSYRIKHLVEDHLGRYVANGELIAAGIIAGYAFKPDRGGPNVHFAMSERSLNEIEKTRYNQKKKLRAEGSLDLGTPS